MKLLQHRWRFPSLSIHGIEGAFSEPGCKTVIPRKVIGKFSIRIVPNQTPEKVEQVVVAYLNKQWKVRGSTNKMKVYSTLLCHNVLPSSVWNICKNYSCCSESLLRIMTITRDIMWQELLYNNSIELNAVWEVVTHLVKKFPLCCKTLWFIAMVRRACHWTLPWARLIFSTASFPISFSSILILFWHVYVFHVVTVLDAVWFGFLWIPCCWFYDK